MRVEIEFELEADGRWMAEIVAIPGVMTYGRTRAEAEANVRALALRALNERNEDHA
jgi:predicted RNase H-like HicB family nuclease